MHRQAIEQIKAVVGPQGWLADTADLAPHLSEWRKILQGECELLVRPANRDEVAEVVEICHRANIPITPQGGNTGMVGGAVPAGGILLSSSRLRTIRELDADNLTMTVEAGCLLAEVQQAAADVGLLFPLSLASEGSCSIGGNIATNAGGNHTIRYGNTRALVLGLEVVLPDGRIWHGLKQLRKNNTGYDLKQLFIGSEGTLGIITAAVLQLLPAPSERITAMASATSWQQLLQLLGIIQGRLSNSLVAFEVFTELGMEITVRHIADAADPFSQPYAFYALIEVVCYGDDSAKRELLLTALEEAMEQSVIEDAVIAQSSAQAEKLWFLREALPEAQSAEANTIKHDISVPISKVPQLIEQGSKAAIEAVPGCRVLPFGHMGDGNIHFNLLVPDSFDRDQYLQSFARANEVLYDLTVSLGGSFSAEHGIGQVKLEEMQRYTADVELDLMARIKSAIDPLQSMNPGKIFSSRSYRK